MKKKLLISFLILIFVLAITTIASITTTSFASTNNHSDSSTDISTGNSLFNSKRITVILELLKEEQIKEFRLPAALEIIEEEAFEGTALVKVELPETVTTIGERAFANITSLRSIRIPVATEAIALTAFEGSNNVTINAASNSYAKKYARAMGLPFAPVVSFCATNTSTTVYIGDTESTQEVIGIDTSEDQIQDRQWHRVDEIKVVGTLVIIFNEIQGRGPPMGEVNC